jgi:hypothetical protein
MSIRVVTLQKTTACASELTETGMDKGWVAKASSVLVCMGVRACARASVLLPCVPFICVRSSWRRTWIIGPVGGGCFGVGGGCSTTGVVSCAHLSFKARVEGERTGMTPVTPIGRTGVVTSPSFISDRLYLALVPRWVGISAVHGRTDSAAASAMLPSMRHTRERE